MKTSGGELLLLIKSPSPSPEPAAQEVMEGSSLPDGTANHTRCAMGSSSKRFTLKPAFLIAAVALISPLSVQAQQQGPNERREQQIREHEIQMKNTDLERVRNRDPKAALAQVNEDFRRLKAINSEVIGTNAAAEPDFKAVAQAADEIRRRGVQLRARLALPAAPKGEKPAKNQEKPGDEQIKSSLLILNSLISSFAANPIFSPTVKSGATIDPQEAARARRDLDDI